MEIYLDDIKKISNLFKEKKELETNLKMAIDALKTIRKNRTMPGDWEALVIDKCLAMIDEPENFDWSHLSKKKDDN